MINKVVVELHHNSEFRTGEGSLIRISAFGMHTGRDSVRVCVWVRPVSQLSGDFSRLLEKSVDCPRGA